MRRLRFGLLAIFATMLIVIGVAGWLRGELDLYREEQALLAEFAKAGCTPAAFRGELDVARLNRGKPSGWTEYVPDWLKRVSWISVTGDPPDDLRARALGLPTLRRFEVRPEGGLYAGSFRTPLPTFPASESLLGRPLPAFRDATIDRESLAGPLPDGDAIEGPKREQILASVSEAWRSAAFRAPTRFVKRIEATNVDAMTVDLIRDGESFWCLQRGPHVASEESRLLTLSDSRNEFGLSYENDQWRVDRQADTGLHAVWRLHSAAEFSKIELPRVSWDKRRLDTAILSHIARVARVDEDRIRLEVEPFELDFSVPPIHQESVTIKAMSLVLREDMNWAVTSERTEFVPTDSNIQGTAKRYVMERSYERRDGFVLPVEELGGYLYPPKRTRYAWELNPDLDSAIFHPNRYLAEPPAPRTRPFPWYLIPLAIGLATVAFLIARSLYRLVRHRGRSKRPEPAEAPG